MQRFQNDLGRGLSLAGLMVGAVALAACGATTRSSYLDTVYAPDRAKLGSQPVPPPPVEPSRHIDIVNPDPTQKSGGTLPSQPDTIAGTWTFVTPPTVTRVERKTAMGGGYNSEYTLYNGRPG